MAPAKALPMKSKPPKKAKKAKDKKRAPKDYRASPIAKAMGGGTC